MTTTASETTTKQPIKKTNLLDHHSIKHLLDETVTEVVTNKGYSEDVRMSNVRLLIGAVIIIIALKLNLFDPVTMAIMCCSTVITADVYTKEKNAFLFTYPHVGSAYTSTGLMVSSKLPRFSDMYTLTIASADPKSISAKPTVEFTKSVTKWFTYDGVLVEGLFWKDVEDLINDYANAKENKKSK
ncbi:probable signal peptidase complex subunit 2 [Tanacetum coccineum]